MDGRCLFLGQDKGLVVQPECYVYGRYPENAYQSRVHQLLSRKSRLHSARFYYGTFDKEVWRAIGMAKRPPPILKNPTGFHRKRGEGTKKYDEV